MDPRARNELTETYRRTRLIGVAMIAALFFYALIVEMIYLFLSLSVVLFGIYFPRYEQWEAWARKG